MTVTSAAFSFIAGVASRSTLVGKQTRASVDYQTNGSNVTTILLTDANERKCDPQRGLQAVPLLLGDGGIAAQVRRLNARRQSRDLRYEIVAMHERPLIQLSRLQI